ncbi:Uncharacterized protein TCM_038999 [Theobroma cacao]|uniref:Uncharacterized protein n=1 Tax=Theobroma cacao TaxID=3641 RepID=A0A061GRM6_THECC|nr:Uncharacterized protein TCM_038999 [Theobroma cacao]
MGKRLYLKSMGRIGLVDFEVRNRALSNKWLWRYGNEAGSLRGRLWQLRTNMILVPCFLKLRCLINALKCGNGCLIYFWTKPWLNDMILKDEFPRLFALAVNKNGKLNEFGVWTEVVWQWRIELRRNLFGWEPNQWSNLWGHLQVHTLSKELDDKVIWKATTSGRLRTFLEKQMRSLIVEQRLASTELQVWFNSLDKIRLPFYLNRKRRLHGSGGGGGDGFDLKVFDFNRVLDELVRTYKKADS